MKNDEFGDRQKFYEKNNVISVFPKGVPVIARIDGRKFSKFTKGMNRPYDARMSLAMGNTTKRLVEETNARIGYTQSDEITLIWYSDNPKSELWFGGKMQKMVSQTAALATLYFYQYLDQELGEYKEKSPTFDSRVWFVPTQIEACNALLWRERDAIKNSISMAASEYYSNNELIGKNGSEKQEMLFKKGVNWNDYPPFFKRGSIYKKVSKLGSFTKEELESLPEKHAARTNPLLMIERSSVECMPSYIEFGKVPDKEKFIFG